MSSGGERRATTLAIAVLAPGLVAALAVLAASYSTLELGPGTPAWSRLASGAERDGLLRQRTVLLLPGLPAGSWLLAVEAERRDGGPVALSIGTGTGPLLDIRTARDRPALLRLPPRNAPGARIDLVPDPRDSPARLLRLSFSDPARPSPAAPIAAFALAAALVAVISRRLPLRLAAGLGLAMGGLVAAARVTLPLLLTLPSFTSVWRVAVPWLVLGASALWIWSMGPEARRVWLRGTALLAAIVFGAWIRGYFLPSTGSWDTEYWKAWMLRAAGSGVTRVYGDADAVPPGHALAQLRGQEELWKVEFHGRAFVVDYPPLAMAAWRWSWWWISTYGRLDSGEAENAAVKVPPVLGDVTAVLVLLWARRRTPARAAAMAALYWALPVSWLSSAVLGFLDGAHAPLVAGSLVAAGSGQPVLAGVALAAAALIKPTALIVAPAVLMALLATGASWRRALVSGTALVTVVLAPFLLAGTLTTAVVHVYRILFQGTLSGGYPNPWWLLGHLLTAGGETSGWGPVRYVRLDTLSFPARPIGALLFAAWAVFVVVKQRGNRGRAPAALAAAALMFGYGMLAVGVHENHPHPLVLLLLATGLEARRLKAIAALMIGVYVTNMLLLSGLGRLHGTRYLAIEPLSRWTSGLRMGLGFDLTLLLVVLDVVALVILAAHLRSELGALAEPSPATLATDGRI